jgi:hypothetical protein
MTDTFTCTSDTLYDRHNYEVVLKSGKNVIFENWEDAHSYWWEKRQIPDFLDLIIVKDKKNIKSKGFSQ